jgi:hypothetical protein
MTFLRQEPCQPYQIPTLAYLAGNRAPVSIAEVVSRLNRFQLELLACAFSGADPEAFERWLREVSSAPERVS